MAANDLPSWLWLGALVAVLAVEIIVACRRSAHCGARWATRSAQCRQSSRWGVNGGAEPPAIGGRVALMGEVRVFYFRDYELSFDAENGPPILDQWLDSLAPVQFDPVFVNVQAGVTFRF